MRRSRDPRPLFGKEYMSPCTLCYLAGEVGRKAVVIVVLSGDSQSESSMEEALEALLENDVIAYVLQIYDASKRDNCDVLHIYGEDGHGESLLKKLAEATGGGGV